MKGLDSNRRSGPIRGLLAGFENVRRRMAREHDRTGHEGRRDALLALLPPLDTFANVRLRRARRTRQLEAGHHEQATRHKRQHPGS